MNKAYLKVQRGKSIFHTSAILLLLAVSLSGCSRKSMTLDEVTQAQFDKIQIGMTPAEIETIMGRPESMSAGTSSGSDKLETLTWHGADKDSISVTIENGRVTGKSRSGLQ